jgi:hypothetical protein
MEYTAYERAFVGALFSQLADSASPGLPGKPSVPKSLPGQKNCFILFWSTYFYLVFLVIVIFYNEYIYIYICIYYCGYFKTRLVMSVLQSISLFNRVPIKVLSLFNRGV